MALPTPLYALLKGNVYLTVAGAQSETDVDVTNFDQSNYRDGDGGSFRLPMIPQATPVGGSTTPLVADLVIGKAVDTVITKMTGYTAGNNVSLPDEIMHHAPRNESFKRTERRWWDGAGGTGNLVGKCWLDRLIGWSGGAAPRRV